MGAIIRPQTVQKECPVVAKCHHGRSAIRGVDVDSPQHCCYITVVIRLLNCTGRRGFSRIFSPGLWVELRLLLSSTVNEQRRGPTKRFSKKRRKFRNQWRSIRADARFSCQEFALVRISIILNSSLSKVPISYTISLTNRYHTPKSIQVQLGNESSRTY